MACRLQLTRQLDRRVELLITLADGHEMDVVRRHRGGPAEAGVVQRLFGDRGNRARDTDAVRPHGDADRLTVRTLRVELECVGVLAAELEDVPDLDAASDLQRRTAAGAPVAVADLNGTDLPRRLEVSAAG